MAIDPEKALKAKALAATGVSALLGQRFYASSAPQDVAFPYAVYGIAKDEPVTHMGGQSGWTQASIDVGIFGHTYESVKAVADRIRIGCNSFKGTVTVGVETAKVGLIRLESKADTPVPVADGSSKPIYGITQTWLVSMEQATS